MADDTNTAEREALMDLIDAYAEARHVGGCHTYNAKTAEARAKVVASLAASAGSDPVATEFPNMPETWHVSAHVLGQPILTIGYDWLAGKGELSDAETQAVIGMAQHLLAFVGYGLPPSNFDPDADDTEATHPSPPEGMAGWTKAAKQLPPCGDDQDFIGINTAGFAGVFNAVRVIDGNTYCLMETAEESVSIMSDLDVWKPFIRPPLPASEAKEL